MRSAGRRLSPWARASCWWSSPSPSRRRRWRRSSAARSRRESVQSWRSTRGRGPGTKASVIPAAGLVRLSFSDARRLGPAVRGLCAEAAGDTVDGTRAAVSRWCGRAAARRLICRTALQNALIGAGLLPPRHRHAGHDAQPDQDGAGIAGHVRQMDRQGAGGRTGRHGGRSASGSAASAGELVWASSPDLAIVMRAAPAYTGTLAMGLGAIAYFEKGAPASTSKVVALAGSSAGVERRDAVRQRFEAVLAGIRQPARLIGEEAGAGPGFGGDSRGTARGPRLSRHLRDRHLQPGHPDPLPPGPQARGVGVERAYLPWVDAIAAMRRPSVPLLTLETWTPVADAHLLGITLQHEFHYTNLLEMLDLAGIPLHAAERGRGAPAGARRGTGLRQLRARWPVRGRGGRGRRGGALSRRSSRCSARPGGPDEPGRRPSAG